MRWTLGIFYIEVRLKFWRLSFTPDTLWQLFILTCSQKIVIMCLVDLLIYAFKAERDWNIKYASSFLESRSSAFVTIPKLRILSNAVPLFIVERESDEPFVSTEPKKSFEFLKITKAKSYYIAFEKEYHSCCFTDIMEPRNIIFVSMFYRQATQLQIIAIWKCRAKGLSCDSNFVYEAAQEVCFDLLPLVNEWNATLF